jgi:plastocyanin
MRPRWTIAAAIVALALASAACSNDGGAGSGSTGAAATTGPTGSSGSSGGRYGYGSGGSGTSGGGGTGSPADVTVTVVNYQFDPARIVVHQGDVVEARDTNPQTPHTFTVRGTDIDLSLDPQGSQTATIDLAPGTYQVYCRFHVSLGMKATLIVR